MKNRDEKRIKKSMGEDKNKKPHYKKHLSGIYNKKKFHARGKLDDQDDVSGLQEQMIDQEMEQASLKAEQEITMQEKPVKPKPVKKSMSIKKQAKPIKSEDRPKKVKEETSQSNGSAATSGQRLAVQTVLAAGFVLLGAVILLSTILLVYSPMKQSNKIMANQRLESRMELSSLISDVFPSMKADDELGEVVLRALENKKNTLQNESNSVSKEIESLRMTDQKIAKLLADAGYENVAFSQLITNSEQTEQCIGIINQSINVIDLHLETLGVAKLKEEIASLKGTVTTVTREDEDGNPITETVISDGLVPEAQAKKDELQKKYDDLKAKLDTLDEYLDTYNGKITAMYNRLDTDKKAYDVFGKMEAIVAYVKENPEDNMFLQDTAAKLESFPGESKEEDDILFIMKVESETGIRMQTVNYGQDYQHKKLSNGMLLCYEVYSIPYYATYQGMKNLIAYFNDNDDFYASVYTLTMQYNPADQTIRGNMIILHYYLLDADAEYVPPVIDEEIIPGIDGIFGEVTDNGKVNGPQSDYTPEEIESWLDQGMSLEQVRDLLISEGYPETELLWILKKKYQSKEEITGFLEKYGDKNVDFNDQVATLAYLQELFPNQDLATLIEIYNAKLPEDDNPGVDLPEDSEESTGGESSEVPEQGDDQEESTTGKMSTYTMDDIKEMMGPDRNMSLQEVRDKLKDEEYPAIELAWIIREEYQSEAEVLAFMLEHGEVFDSLEDASVFFECNKEELLAIYRSES